MTPSQEIAPGLVIRGFTPPLPLDRFKLLVFGMDSALLYPGAEELVDACKAAGMAIDMVLGELTHGADKLAALHATCDKLGIAPDQVVVVGHAESDLLLMVTAGLTVSFLAPPDVAAQAMVALQSGGLDRLLQVVSLPSTCGPAALDLSVLEALVDHDAIKFRKFALLFISSIESVLAEVDTAITHGNLATLMAMGHRAKSTARNIGAEAFAHQCLLLEQSARAQNTAAALQVARALRSSFDGIRMAIETRLADSA